MRCWLTTLLALMLADTRAQSSAQRHTFYRAMDGGGARGQAGGGRAGGTRRVFGGRSAALEEWGAACALLDRYWSTRCSASVLAPRWALTAAHCVTPHLAYVKYNARRPTAPQGDVQPVLYLYRHPEYKVVQEDEGRGMDVTVLHHDVGLVRTRGHMHLVHPPALTPLCTLPLYDLNDIHDQEVQVLGFGRTERSVQGEELFTARLRVVRCERGTWYHCWCGVSAEGEEVGVCAGDSGGPVLYRGVQVAVTSMGPLECEAAGGGAGGTVPGATSVLTSLPRYTRLINDTIHSVDATLYMQRESRAPPSPSPSLCPALLLVAAPLLLAT